MSPMTTVAPPPTATNHGDVPKPAPRTKINNRSSNIKCLRIQERRQFDLARQFCSASLTNSSRHESPKIQTNQCLAIASVMTTSRAAARTFSNQSAFGLTTLTKQQQKEYEFLMSINNHILESLSNPGKEKVDLPHGNTVSERALALQNDSSSADDGDGDTEDSADKFDNKPKPGKLDLRQFDNITNAIGKLQVQPKMAIGGDRSAQKSAQHSHKQSAQQQELSGFFKNRTKKSKNRSTPAAAEVTNSAAPNASLAITLGSKRSITNQRQNHGRAVAPPKLPGRLDSSESLLTANSATSASKSAAQTAVSYDALAHLGDDSNELNQSPITARLLKHTKDHKVSELNSPYGSDHELPTTPAGLDNLQSQSRSINASRSQKLLRGHSLGFTEVTGRHSTAAPAASALAGAADSTGLLVNSSVDSSELITSRDATIRQLNEILANKPQITPPGRTADSGHLKKPNSVRGWSYEQQQSLDQPTSSERNDKDSAKKDKKKLRDDEKLEKRRLKEEERLRRQEKKLAAKKTKSGASGTLTENSVDEDGIPLFIKRCIEFIESEGLEAEGIYRVPGNRAHVDAFVQKFKENPEMSIVDADIPVNAVATALKDFLSKKWGPIVPPTMMKELTELSNISEKEQRVRSVRTLIKKLPPTNYRLLKYVFAHFVKISLNSSLNSMDSKNLAICWWPTLLPLHFNDMVMFEQMRPHLEESIQTLIDQYDYVFDDEPLALNA